MWLPDHFSYAHCLLVVQVEDLERKLDLSTTMVAGLREEAEACVKRSADQQREFASCEQQVANLKADLKTLHRSKQLADEEKMKSRQAQLDAVGLADQRAAQLEAVKQVRV